MSDGGLAAGGVSVVEDRGNDDADVVVARHVECLLQ